MKDKPGAPAIATMSVTLLLGVTSALAGTNELSPIQTNFIWGAVVASGDLDTVAKLANDCGIDHVMSVSTERHLNGISIVVTGDESVVDRKVTFNTLLMRRKGWPGGERPGASAKSLGEFWVGAPAQAKLEERAVVKVGDRTFHVGLLDGIQPAGADKIMEAFVKGRVRFGSERIRDALVEIDVTQPRWIGVSGDRIWITFASPLTRFIFTLKGDEVVLLDKVEMYE